MEKRKRQVKIIEGVKWSRLAGDDFWTTEKQNG